MTDVIPQVVTRSLKIGFFGKGGSGKSTMTVLLARELARRGLTVLVLDSDPTNSSLASAFGVPDPARELVDCLGGLSHSGGARALPAGVPGLPDASRLLVSELPSGAHSRVNARLCVLTAGKLWQHAAETGRNGRICEIARDVRFRDEQAAAVTFVDLKAGLDSDARGVAAALDWALVVVDPTWASLALARHVCHVWETNRSAPRAPEHAPGGPRGPSGSARGGAPGPLGVLCVLNQIPDGDAESFVRAELARADIHPLGAIHRDPRIGEAWLHGTALPNATNSEETRGIADRLVQMTGLWPREARRRRQPG